MAQRVGIVVVTPALRRQQHGGPDQRGEVVCDVGLAARILQPRGHPGDDAAPFQHFPEQHRTRVAGEPIGAAFHAQSAVEPGRDRL